MVFTKERLSSFGHAVLIQPFKDMYSFFVFGKREFGLMFLIMIAEVYFMQGFRNYAFYEGIIWYFRSVFNLDPGPTQSIRSTIMITWNIKMLYGLVFDNFPIFKRNDQPWLIIAAIIQIVGFVGLGIDSWTTSPDTVTGFFWLALMGMAMGDVIADAMVIKKAKRVGAKGGSSLQTYCWIMLFMGSLIGRPVSGYVVGDGDGAKLLLGTVYAATSSVILLAGILLKEKRGNIQITVRRLGHQVVKLVKGILFNKTVFFPALWIVLSGALVPNVDTAISYWKNDEISVGPDLQSYIDTVGDCFGIIGLLLYARFFKQTSFRKIFFWTQIIALLFAFSDIILIKRWNVAIGLPDLPFLIGSTTIQNSVSMVQQMPYLVMAAQLCPDDIEATFFATLMSLSNGGANVGTKLGAIVTDALSLQVVDGKINYEMLEYGVWIKLGGMFIVALLVFVLIPDTTLIMTDHVNPDDMTVYEREQLEVKAAGGDMDAKIALENESIRLAKLTLDDNTPSEKKDAVVTAV